MNEKRVKLKEDPRKHARRPSLDNVRAKPEVY
jgi:hypothetical protein